MMEEHGISRNFFLEEIVMKTKQRMAIQFFKKILSLKLHVKLN